MRLIGRYGIRKPQIRQTLQLLFERLGDTLLPMYGETRICVAAELTNLLKIDFQSGGLSSKGLRNAREAFVILAYLAHEWESVMLAGALMHFWVMCMHGIMHQEHRGYLQDWHKALGKIQELGPEGMVQGPPHMPGSPLATIPYTPWNHGRMQHPSALPWPVHRARSAPAARRRHSPDMRLALPAAANSAWTSPMMSPVGNQRAGYFDDIDNLQYQQQEVKMKLNDVNYKLDLLVEQFY
ncbi:hypothetical protein EJ02DRAFT_445748 [Clathrospora elynae]|uniref:Uncharacterized protein n=1 Tax=Clathrospora elynae TaxID=706981 RepID=A0A6A5SK60_9PLEO|nr:hypothetical protein EJ02DRAFT_445748 [Clathrospora elynae]